jgi:hypothetical protein
MMRILGWLIAVVAVSASIGFAADDAATEVRSGLPVGEIVPAFNVRDITGPQKGKTLCYRCRYGNAPTIAVFAREIEPSLQTLIKRIDDRQQAHAERGLKSFVIFIHDDPDAIEPEIEKLANAQNLSGTPLTLIEGVQGPPDYKLSRDAAVTVMMWVDGRVKFNQAFTKGRLSESTITSLVEQALKVLGN